MAGAEMIAAQLRVKEADRWSAHICRLKFHSFTSEFPEVTEAQFLWAAEQWIQRTNATTFIRYPSWKELMAPLYRTENGLANRSWGFKEVLPEFLKPTPAQVAMLPQQPLSLAAPPDAANAEAYVPFHVEELRALPPAPHQEPLTKEKWSAYLQELEVSA